MRLTSSQRESVVAWIPQHDPRRPQPGQNARVRPLPVHNASWLATVLQVGDSVELLPEHQRSDPGVPEWGVPVRLSLPEGLPARPGERLDVRF